MPMDWRHCARRTIRGEPSVGKAVLVDGTPARHALGDMVFENSDWNSMALSGNGTRWISTLRVTEYVR